MTRILALDSSTDACSVALSTDGVVTQLFELAVKSHTQRLLPMVAEILDAQGLVLADIDAIAFGRGPGSFTGLRICMGVVQGLAFGANLPVIPVSCLQAMAYDYCAVNPQNQLPILAALDARMDEVYWGLFSAGAQPTVLTDEQVMKPASVCEQPLVAQLHKQFVAIGSGWHYQDFASIKPAYCVEQVFPQAGAIASLAAALDKRYWIPIEQAQPVYLRDTVSWQKRQRIRTQAL
jgi:tRNA threonylcarbamoyladenosine biosynthesis protein TsaB